MIEPQEPPPEPTAKELLKLRQVEDLKRLDGLFENADFQQFFLKDLQERVAAAEGRVRDKSIRGVDLELAREHWLTLTENIAHLEAKRASLRKTLETK